MSTRRPLIGLPGRRKLGRQIDGLPENFADATIDVYLAAYAQGVHEAGGIPLHLPVDLSPHDVGDRLDGIVLPGGPDVDPLLYGEEPTTDLYPPETERDHYEMALFDMAMTNGTPVLGICRGLQLINVHLGGTLHQHVPAHARYDVEPAATTHDVTFTSGSLLAAIYPEPMAVNSMHHQTIASLADGIVVSATSDDNEIEGIEHETLPIVAVQWHPEMMTTRGTDPVFAWLIDAASAQLHRRG